MENNYIKSSYNNYQENRILDKTMPKFDMLKTLDNYKKSVDAFNSYGLKKKIV
jgi:hypothetical protein